MLPHNSIRRRISSANRFKYNYIPLKLTSNICSTNIKIGSNHSLPISGKGRAKMTITELAKEYKKQYELLCCKIEGLRPLLVVYSGEDLLHLRKKIRVYYDMALECRHTWRLLESYYDDSEET